MRTVFAAVALTVSVLLVAQSSPTSTVVAAFAPPTAASFLKTRSSHQSRLFASVEETEDEYLVCARDSPLATKPDVCYIIMYNPSTPQEGIHTMTYPRGSEDDLLLAFESLDDCVAFAQIIREDASVQYGEPVPTPTSMLQIESACQRMDLPLAIVPASSSSV